MASTSPTPSWKVLGVAKVLYPYSAQGSTELNIAVGDIVNVVEKYPNGWWVGEMNGKVGVFPGAYVTLEETAVQPKDNADDGNATAVASATATTTTSTPATPTPTPTSTTTPNTTAPLRARALYDFNRTTASELSFNFNDELVITEKLEGGWWRAELNGKTGLVPKNYLQELTSPPTSTTKPALSLVTATNKNRDSAAIGSDAAPAPIGLASTKMRTSMADVTPVPENRLSTAVVALGLNNNANNFKQPTSQPPSTTGHLFKVKALYDFPGKESNQLPLKKGDIIPVKLVPADGNPWWLGELDGRKGYFPMNYVQKIAENEDTATKDAEEPKVLLRAAFDFEGRNTTELSFKKGQLITLIKKLQPEGGWWKGEIVDPSGTKTVGNFPSNYVTVIDNNEISQVIQTQESEKSETVGETTAQNPTAPSGFPPKEKVIVWAIESYNALSPSELSFKRGDKIEVLEEAKQDGWAHGEKDNGERGYFPYSFVTTDLSSFEPEHPPPPPEEDRKHPISEDVSKEQADEEEERRQKELEESKQKLEEEDRTKREEEESRLSREQAARQQQEEEARRQHEEEERRKLEEEERKKAQEEELRIQLAEAENRHAEELRIQVEAQQQEESRRQQEEAARLREEEARQQEEAARMREEELRLQEEAARRREEELRQQEEAAAKLREEEARKRHEEEQRRIREEEEKQRIEEEQKRQQVELRIQEERRQQEEEQRKQREEEELRRRKVEEQNRLEEARKQEEVKRKEEELQAQKKELELKRQKEEEEIQRKKADLQKQEEELKRQREEVERKQQLAETRLKQAEAQNRISPSSSLSPSPSSSPPSASSVTELPKVNIPKVTRPLPVPKPKRNVPSGASDSQSSDSVIRALERKLQLESDARRQLEAKVAQLETKLEALSKAFADFQSSSPTTTSSNVRANLRPTGRDLTR
eukprot:TRINITY_DN7297_c0_g1_i1.p1 TRINITY_DN7297_c0_g1~~TRINITY_DN7297_c0_g1_i1.p1  ORF type:complete len:937 (+),score=336.38 TRINITY_DN7297_c0_g1_i1:194-3004(+)